MKKVVLIVGWLMMCQASFSQEVVSIEEDFEVLTQQWHQVSDRLVTYEGLGQFCGSPDFRQESIQILSTIHHIDSLIMDLMMDPTSGLEVSKQEYKKTLDDIRKFESEYGIRSFIEFLRESCLTRNELEANIDDLKNENGIYSYDGQVLMLETRLEKYLKHLGKKVDAIDEHVHHIHPDQLKAIKLLAANEAD